MATTTHQYVGPACVAEGCCACRPPGPGGTPQTSVHLRVEPFHLACGRRMRALNAPKVDKDGNPIRYPVYAVSHDIELVSCNECRVAVGAGRWGGRIVPLRWGVAVKLTRPIDLGYLAAEVRR